MIIALIITIIGLGILLWYFGVVANQLEEEIEDLKDEVERLNKDVEDLKYEARKM